MNHEDAGIRRRVSEPVYPKDLLSELTLIFAPPDVKGAWAWTLFSMWDNGTDRIKGTFEEFGRLWGCSAEDAERLSREISARKIGVVTLGHKIVTLMSRRLARRKKAQDQARKRKRQERLRARHACVTAKKGTSSSSSSSSSSGLTSSIRGKEGQRTANSSILDPGKEGDIYRTIHDPTSDPVALAFMVTGEKYNPRAEGFYKKAIGAIGEKVFRGILAEVAGEAKVDKIDNVAAILANKIKARMERGGR